MDVRVASFGFKYGLPLEADLVFDVRFLPNPYYIPGTEAPDRAGRAGQKLLYSNTSRRWIL